MEFVLPDAFATLLRLGLAILERTADLHILALKRTRTKLSFHTHNLVGTIVACGVYVPQLDHAMLVKFALATLAGRCAGVRSSRSTALALVFSSSRESSECQGRWTARAKEARQTRKRVSPRPARRARAHRLQRRATRHALTSVPPLRRVR